MDEHRGPSIGDTVVALIMFIPVMLMVTVVGVTFVMGMMLEDACCWAKRKADAKRERDAKHSD